MLAIGMAAVAVMNLNTIIKKYERGENNMQSLFSNSLKKKMHQNDEISLFFFITIFITISLFLSGGIFEKKWNILVNIHIKWSHKQQLSKQITNYLYIFFLRIWLNLYLEAIVVIHLKSKEPEFYSKTPYGFGDLIVLASKWGYCRI